MKAAEERAEEHDRLPPGAVRGADGVVRVPGRMGALAADMFRSLALIGGLVAIVVIFQTVRPPDPVRTVDPRPVAAAAAEQADFAVLLPADSQWRATYARYEPTEKSAGAAVWAAGGVVDGDDTFAGISQSTASSESYLAEQTLGGTPAGGGIRFSGRTWTLYRADGRVSFVSQSARATTVVSTSGDEALLARFAASLRPVG